MEVQTNNNCSAAVQSHINLYARRINRLSVICEQARSRSDRETQEIFQDIRKLTPNRQNVSRKTSDSITFRLSSSSTGHTDNRSFQRTYTVNSSSVKYPTPPEGTATTDSSKRTAQLRANIFDNSDLSSFTTDLNKKKAILAQAKERRQKRQEEDFIWNAPRILSCPADGREPQC